MRETEIQNLGDSPSEADLSPSMPASTQLDAAWIYGGEKLPPTTGSMAKMLLLTLFLSVLAYSKKNGFFVCGQK